MLNSNSIIFIKKSFGQIQSYQEAFTLFFSETGQVKKLNITFLEENKFTYSLFLLRFIKLQTQGITLLTQTRSECSLSFVLAGKYA